jgi:hypothetical protein
MPKLFKPDKEQIGSRILTTPSKEKAQQIKSKILTSPQFNPIREQIKTRFLPY